MQRLVTSEKKTHQSHKEDEPFQLVISKDKMEARLVCAVDGAPLNMNEEDVVAYLEERGITNVDLRAVHNLAERCAASKDCGIDMVVARGQHPGQGEDGRIEWCKAIEQLNRPAEIGEEKIDWREQRKFATVSEGEVLATIIPPRPGTDGLDVMGNSLPAGKGRAVVIKAGANVTVSDDGQLLVAKVGGRPVIENNSIKVERIIYVEGDVDFETGNIDLDGDVVIRGTVRDNFKVLATGNIDIGAFVEGATIVSGGDLVIQGGISAREKGSITVGGKLLARFLSNASIECNGDANIKGGIINCHMRVGGNLFIEQKGVVGGNMVVDKSIECNVLGSEAGVRTKIEAGMNIMNSERMTSLKKEIEKIDEESERLSQEIEPLKSVENSLSSQERETHSELISQIEDANARKQMLEQDIKKELNKEAKWCTIRIRDKIYPGVIIEMAGRYREVTEKIPGPVTVSFDADEMSIVFH